jgi:drug/metabolite transporter (DMT)-like permease
MLVALAAMWGSSFLFMRIGAPALGPLVLIELRVLLAGLALLLIAAVRRQPVRILHKWKAYLILGAANAAIPFTLIATAELHVSAALAAILNATTPLFTAFVAWAWSREPFTWKKLTGVFLGIVGVAILVGWDTHGEGGSLLVSVACSLIAALFYAVAGVFSSKYFKGESPMDMAIGQQVAAALLLVPFAAFTLPSAFPSSDVVFSVLTLAVLCTALAYLVYFALMQRVGPVKTLSVTFLVPIFGLIWGAVFLGEPVTAGAITGLLVILLSVALVANVPLGLRRKQK